MEKENFDYIVDNGNVIEMSNITGWICPICGVSVSPGALYCPICGQKNMNCGERTNEGFAPGEKMICS